MFKEENLLEINLKIQNQIIKTLKTENFDFLFSPSISVTTEERETILNEIATGAITEERINKILETVPGPIPEFNLLIKKEFFSPGDKEKISQLYETLNKNKKLQIVYYDLIEKLFPEKKEISMFDESDSLKNIFLLFLKTYPTPLSLEKALETKEESFSSEKIEKVKKEDPALYKWLLENLRLKEEQAKIKRRSWEEKFNENFEEGYSKAFLEFKKVVYGKRQDYWEQIQLLKKEAEKVRQVKTERKEIFKELENLSLEEKDYLELKMKIHELLNEFNFLYQKKQITEPTYYKITSSLSFIKNDLERLYKEKLKPEMIQRVENLQTQLFLKKIGNEIENAKKIEEIAEISDRYGQIIESQFNFSTQKLIELLTKVRNNELDPSYLPSFLGLREKVEFLLKGEKLEKHLVFGTEEIPFKPFQRVKVMQPSGEIEDGWWVSSYSSRSEVPRGYIVVCKEEISPATGKKRIIKKIVSLKELKKWNK